MNATAEGRSLELYFIEGKPDGMLTAEVFNWTGHVLMTPRTRIGPALSRKEASFTGIYLLLGEKDGQPCAYIGEGEDISDRIRNHDGRKDWWTTAVLVTSMANNLNKAHVKYLEARLVEEAKATGRVMLDNGNTPVRAGLTEAGQSNMEAFLNYLFMVLPALGVNLFVKNTRPTLVTLESGSGPRTTTPVFTLSIPTHGLTAKAVLDDGDFVVLSGSLARRQWSGMNTEDSGYARLHEELKRTGVLRDDGDHCIFTQNYAFSSPSAAAAVVYGSFISGPGTWKLEDGRTYKEWEAAQLSESAEATE
ncbi:GIY-YIG nuclease family protein [Hyphomicrobium sp. NDB2Meth4]|uniref:GIY-YIG nuclease family protein n=1 Tax=Hyphomicrobium sp. NDB2Meth4 TaxID=1892846 RepID=UPI000930A283|nr:GIY-YIG nuclease family protein [Hyphomicrobium sp. NDB2Meth4]